MTTEQQDVLQAVEQLNDELYIKYLDNVSLNAPVIAVTFIGDIFAVTINLVNYENINIPEFQLFNSVENDRIFYESTNEYETYYHFIIRKYNEIQNEICKYKL